MAKHLCCCIVDYIRNFRNEYGSNLLSFSQNISQHLPNVASLETYSSPDTKRWIFQNLIVSGEIIWNSVTNFSIICLCKDLHVISNYSNNEVLYYVRRYLVHIQKVFQNYDMSINRFKLKKYTLAFNRKEYSILIKCLEYDREILITNSA